MDTPESPEGIALILLYLILDTIKPGEGANLPAGTRILDLYAECLVAARGNREVSHESVAAPLH